jgi:acetolactate synthase-1/2/3 large subunit
MKALDAVAEILKREGVEYLFCFPTTPLIDAATRAGIRPIVCRQERVGLGMADAYSRVTNGKRIGVFAMQGGPGAENAFPGVATAYSDSTPVLLLPSGYPREREGWPRFFTAPRGYAGITKWLEQVNDVSQVEEAMRRAFSRSRMGRPGPVMVELPLDLAWEELGEAPLAYQPVRSARASGDPADIERAARALVQAAVPVIHAGQGVLYAEATPELVELAELLDAPVVTTLLGKSGFPEDHSLSLGTAAGAVTGPASHFLRKADVVLAVGASLAKHTMSATIPDGKTFIQITNDEADLNRNYAVEHPILGDAKLALHQLIDAVRDVQGAKGKASGGAAAEIEAVRGEWLARWMPKLESNDAPINPYRVIWELNRTIPASEAIVTHDSGSPRDQMVPFYRSAGPRSYIGWGKSHALGTGLGFAMGAKLAAPDKVCINWMGDAAFGMTGLDFETAVRARIPITTIVSANSTMAVETSHMTDSHEAYAARDLGGNYADLARALGGWSERVEDPAEIGPALLRARKVNEEEGRPALLEMITSAETERSQG